MNFNPLQVFKKYDLANASAEFTQETLKNYNRSVHTPIKGSESHAPFKSLYFGHEGGVIACCYNRTYKLGFYPDKSIKEIWEGEQAVNLRKYIAENNLDHGCSGCKAQILAGDKSGNKAKSKQYDGHPLNSNGYPSLLEFELSNTCNLECDMCSGEFSSLIRKNREGLPDLKQPYDDAFVDQLDEFIPHLEEAKFFGGEPFLIEFCYKVWERMIELNPKIRITIQTNGTILNNRVKEILSKIKFHIGVSIDSLEKDNYERIRVNAKFERTMENMKWFREYSKKQGTFFGISACAMQENWHELPDFVRLCNDMNVPVYFHTVFFPKKSAFHSLDQEPLEHMVKVLSEKKFSTALTITQSRNKRHFEDTINQLRLLIKEKRFNSAAVSNMVELDDFRKFLKMFIQDYSGWSNSVKKTKLKKVTQKLDLLEKELGPDFEYTGRLATLDFKNSAGVLTIINQIETLPITELAELTRVSAAGQDFNR